MWRYHETVLPPEKKRKTKEDYLKTQRKYESIQDGGRGKTLGAKAAPGWSSPGKDKA